VKTFIGTATLPPMTFPQSDPTAPWPEQPASPAYGPGYPATPTPPVPPTVPMQPAGAPGAYPPPQGGYPQPGMPMQPNPYGYYNPAAQTNTMAILSLVFAFVFPALGIAFGHIARKQIRERGEGGSGLATAGLILGYIFTAIGVLYCVGVIAFVALGTNNT
jgi:Domain of unknown function (DUF4190)